MVSQLYHVHICLIMVFTLVCHTIQKYDVNVQYNIITVRNKGVNLYYKCIILSIMKNHLMNHV